MDLLHSTGRQLARVLVFLHSSGGGTARHRSDRPGGLHGRQGAPHTTVVATGRRASEWLGAFMLLDDGCCYFVMLDPFPTLLDVGLVRLVGCCIRVT
jgi:hypothetical protein